MLVVETITKIRRAYSSLGKPIKEISRDVNAGYRGRSFAKSFGHVSEYVAGAYRQRFALASGRFAMIDNGLGFQLVPWTPSLEKQLGRHVSGVTCGNGGIDWGFGRNRGLGL